MRTFVLFSIAVCLSLPAGAQVATQPEPVASAGEQSWSMLLEGNRAFIKGHPFEFDDIVARRESTAKKQSPRISVIACADSRVSPELLFHSTLGDLFVIRTAGNLVDDFAVASLEFAALPKNEWTDLIVVLGHSGCGAVRAALNPSDPPTPHLQRLVERIRESFDDLPYTAEPPPDVMRTAIEANAKTVAGYISAHSPGLRERIRSGKVKVIAAYHDLATGTVTEIR